MDVVSAGCNDEDGQVNFGIGGGIKPKEFPNASPGGLVNADVNLAASVIILQDSDRINGSGQYQSMTQRDNKVEKTRSV